MSHTLLPGSMNVWVTKRERENVNLATLNVPKRAKKTVAIGCALTRSPRFQYWCVRKTETSRIVALRTYVGPAGHVCSDET